MVDQSSQVLERLSSCLRLASSSSDIDNIGHIAALKKLNTQSTLLHECDGALEKALEHQWLEKWMTTRNMSSISLLSLVNKSLCNRTFLVSNQVTVSDVLWAISLRKSVEAMSFSDREDYVHVIRWFSQVCYLMNINTAAIKSKTLLYTSC